MCMNTNCLSQIQNWVNVNWKTLKIHGKYRLKHRSIVVRKDAYFGNPQAVKQFRVTG